MILNCMHTCGGTQGGELEGIIILLVCFKISACGTFGVANFMVMLEVSRFFLNSETSFQLLDFIPLPVVFAFI